MYRFLLLRRPTVNSYGAGLVHVCASSAHNGPFGLKGIDMIDNRTSSINIFRNCELISICFRIMKL